MKNSKSISLQTTNLQHKVMRQIVNSRRKSGPQSVILVMNELGDSREGKQAEMWSGPDSGWASSAPTGGSGKLKK